MQNRVTIFLLMLIQVGLSMAQPVFHNNVWMWGLSNSNPQYPFGGGKITFETDTALIESDLRNLEFRGSMAYLQTPDRLWSIYTNGYAICNQNHDTITKNASMLYYQLCDLQGRVVQSGLLPNTQGTHQLNLQTEPVGLYFLKVSNQMGESQQMKLMKMGK